MAVVGIDFGTLHSKIGVARHRGIDIITNEVSNRQTPSLVAFGPKMRAIGESAKTQETSNFKNTIGSLKRLIGRSVNDVEVQEYEKRFLNAKLVDVNGVVGTQVNFKGEPHTFSATQLNAMYLAKLRDIASNELKTTVTDVVIAVPGWFTEIQRRSLLDAAAISNLNVLRLINDTTAAALGYGITKSDLPEDDGSAAGPPNKRHVVFVDVGHSSTSVEIVAFWKGHLHVLASAYDRHLGGREIDFALVNHFAKEFKEKYKIDVLSSPKAVFRLTAGCEKLKKVLSANHESVLNVESIMNDIDASSKLTREEYEALVASVLDRIPTPIQQALEDSGLSVDQIDAVELIGGSTRIPAVRAKIQSVFPTKSLSTTLNQDEAVARGATFSCAMLSPTFRVRDFHMTDTTSYPIKVQWNAVTGDEDTELEVFGKGNNLPSTKVLSFARSEPFDIEVVYKNPDGLPGSIQPFIGRLTVKQVPPSTGIEPPTIKVKTRLNNHGIVNVEQVYYEEIEEKEEPAAPTPMDVDGAADPAAAEAPKPKKKRVVKKKDVPFIYMNSSLDKSILEGLKELEGNMWANDKLVTDTEDRKNALEEYVYDTRSKLDDRYAQFVTSQEKSNLLAALQKAEDWLYTEEGEDASKSAYVERLDALKVLGDPITFRWSEFQERVKAASALRETLDQYEQTASSSDDKYSHIDEKDKQSVIEKVVLTRKWLEDILVKQSEKRKDVDPVVKSEDIRKKRDEVIYFATPILTKPKPKPPVVPTPGQGTPSGQDSKSRNETPDPAAGGGAANDMDVD